MMSGRRLDQDRQRRLEPKRVAFAVDQLRRLGIEPESVSDTTVRFVWRGSPVVLFPYSGWHSGRTIRDGRGLDNLLRQLRPEEER